MSKHSKRKYRHTRIHKRDLFRAVFAAVLVLLLLISAFLLVKKWENGAYRVETSSDSPPSKNEKEPELKEITLEGQRWRQREDLETYLFLGIDEAGEAQAVDGYYGGGQADVQMALVLDHANRTWQLLQLNRDTMAEVPILGMQGEVTGSEFQQIALSHSYGDGMKESCRNSVKTVSDLLWGQKFDGYFSMNMGAIEIFNDAIGGVPVTITSDFSKVDESLKLGETITLKGKQAMTFLRIREDVDDQTNLSRMARQRQYLEALFTKLSELDEETALEAYDQIHRYTVTDMGSRTIQKLGEKVREYEKLELLTIDGEQKLEKEHWAYYLEKESLRKVVLQLFYEKI